MILQVESHRFVAKNVTQILYVENGQGQAFQIAQWLVVTIWLKTNIAELLDNTSVKPILLWINLVFCLEFAHGQNIWFLFS